MSPTKDLEKRLAALNADHEQAVSDREQARARERELAERQVQLADDMAAVERDLGDEQALADLRSRKDRIDAIRAAERIAATMAPLHPERAARFSALADELSE